MDHLVRFLIMILIIIIIIIIIMILIIIIIMILELYYSNLCHQGHSIVWQDYQYLI